ncbi:MAG: hypothetical protein J3R72DRAFT_449357 [Linnemannia gamsii]|nr:MAG: hypothetical protein J3R72DRAFT_449357 [Linnemannia gamsii]
MQRGWERSRAEMEGTVVASLFRSNWIQWGRQTERQENMNKHVPYRIWSEKSTIHTHNNNDNNKCGRLPLRVRQSAYHPARASASESRQTPSRLVLSLLGLLSLLPPYSSVCTTQHGGLFFYVLCLSALSAIAITIISPLFFFFPLLASQPSSHDSTQ